MNGFKYIRTQISHLSMDKLGEKIGVSKQMIYNWESGRKNIPERRLKQLSEISGIPERYFVIPELSDIDELEIKRYQIQDVINEVRKLEELLSS